MKWEYKTAAVGGHNENEFGAEGWEMVAVQGGIAWYKRLVEPDEAVDADEAEAVDGTNEPTPRARRK